MGIYLLNICLFMSIVCGVNGQPSLTIRPEYQVLYLIAPAPLNITCEYDHKTKDNKTIEWIKNNTNANDLGYKVYKTEKFNPVLSQFEQTAFCQKSVTSIEDRGQYYCRRDGIATKSIFVEIINVTTQSYIYKKHEASGNLQCLPTMKAGVKVEFALSWERKNKKDVTSVTVIDGLKDRVVMHEHNYSLEIEKPIREDCGDYTCVFTFAQETADEQRREVTVPFYAAPFVKRFDKSKNLIQGDPLNLHCTVVGHPTPSIVWQKDGNLISSLNKTKIVVQDNKETGLKNGTLHISTVEFEDKGIYGCFATTEMFNASGNSTIHVRVKDKLAALWPFLAIVAEVVILCIIIFIYEKKHAKAQEEDDANCQATSANAADTKGKDVRQRNVRA